MNIYQNGAFSEILHKLTKYQALAASAKDFSKQNLYSQKIQEYRNRLDTMNFAQSGGYDQKYKTQVDSVTGKIGQLLVSRDYMDKYKTLLDAHQYVMEKLNGIKGNVDGMKRQILSCQSKTDEQEAELKRNMQELRKKGIEGIDLEQEIQSLIRQLEEAKRGITNNEEDLQKKSKTIRDLQEKLESASDRSESLVPGLGSQLRANTGRIKQLEKEIFGYISQINQLKQELLNQPKSGVASCDTLVGEILKEIDQTIMTVSTTAKPTDNQTEIDKLKQTVEDILSNSRITSS